MARVIVSAVGWFIAITFVYWYSSGASTQVRAVTIAGHLVLCAVVTIFLCLQSVSRTGRIVGAAVGVSLISIISTGYSATMIAFIDSRDPVFYVMGLVGSLILAAAFAMVVGLTEVMLARFWNA